MEIKISAFIFVLLYTVNCTPTKSNDFETGDDYDMQGDNDNYNTNYDDAEEAVEESKMPEGPLVFTSPEEHLIKDIGDTVVLPCAITGGNNYVRIWMRKNTHGKDAVLFQSDIPMAASPNMKLLKDGSLEISNLHVQDAAKYECNAMDTKQNSPKIIHEVILRVPPQIDSLLAKDNVTVLKHGDTLVLTCRTSGYPKPVISWHKGGRLDVHDEVLTIENIRHRDAGTYKCLADNKIGEPAFGYINIQVQYKPVIIIEKITVSSDHNSETELECLVHAEPKAQVVWMKDGVNVVNNNRTQLITHENKHNLILKNLREEDFGSYTCSATNIIGSSKRNISLVATPAILGFNSTQSDGKVELKWNVQSKTNISVHELSYKRKEDNHWKTVHLEELEVNSAGDDIYEVKYTFSKGLDPGDYELKLRSQNQKGWSEQKHVFTVGVHAKHGHHDKPHKKNHKHGKDKQVTPTPTPPSQPAEHQENDNQSGSIKQAPSTDPEKTGSATAPAASGALLIIIALLSFSQARIQSMRI